MRSLSCFLLALVVIAPAAAQAKRSAFAADDRLNKPVTVHWKKATLFEALRDLTRQTGVALTPERGVVDEPVMASASGMPARNLLEQIGTLTGFTWVRYGGTTEKPGYMLFKDAAAAREEEAEVTRARRAVLEALQEQIDNLRRIGRLSPQQLQAEVERSNEELERAFAGGIGALGSNPRNVRRMLDGMSAQTVATPTGRALVDLLESLAPGQWQEVMNEEPLIFSTQPRPGEMMLPPRIGDRLREASPGISVPKSLFRSLGPQVEQAIGQAELMMKNEWGKASAYRITVQLTLNLGAQPVGMLRVAPEPVGTNESIAPIFAAAGLNLIGSPTLNEEMQEDPAEREKRLAADPILGKKAKLKLPPLKQNMEGGVMALLGQSYRTADLLEPVETAFGVHLVADAYNQKALAMVPPPGEAEIPLYKILDQMAGTSRDWELDGTVVRLKSKTWAFDRRSEIPARHMRRWLDARAQKGAFNLDDLAEIAATLRDEQVENLMYSAMEAGARDFTDFVMITANRDALRFWASLLPLQRKSLAGGRTLPAGSLYPRQQAALAQATRPKGGGMFAAFMGPRGKRSPELLARSVVSLEIPSLEPQPGEQPQPGANPRLRIGVPAALYLLRIAYPDGQKDEFRIPVSRPQAAEPQPEAPAPK